MVPAMTERLGHTAVVADDHELLRKGLKDVLQSYPGLTVVAEASDGLAAVSVTKHHQPDLLTLDIAMPFAQGVSVFAEVRRWCPQTRIAIFSGMTSGRVLQALQEAGAEGIFTKRGDMAEFERAIPVMLGGGKVVSADAADIIAAETESPGLTLREKQIISCIANGMTTKAMATHLGISPKTVENHRTNIMAKLGVQSMAELLAYAVREGFFDVQDQL